ncbi:MAG: NAD-binding protein [Schleiferiaceae bacterium]|jgi:voltage-gated potassium channel|nr:NAD-binding protein [Schleiferiaceae bacterium]
MKNPFKALRKLLLILFGIVGFGVTGFMLIEDYSFRNALYMTIQTVSTVGFNEVQPFHSWGKEFTSILIVMSFGTFAFAISQLSQIVISGNLKGYFKYKNTQKKMQSLNQHVIICGYGRNGKQASQTLQAYNQSFVVIEKDQKRIAELKAERNIHFIEGDATDDNILVSAGISRARALLSSLHNDADNIFVVITARQLNPNILITSRANEDNTGKKLQAAGANFTVMPNRVGGGHMAHMIMKPNVVEFLDHLSVGGMSATNIEEIKVEELPDGYKAKTIEDLEIRKKTGCTVVGMKSDTTQVIINPSVDAKLQSDSVIFVLGNEDQIRELKQLFNVATY